MIRKLIAAAGIATALALPGAAQTFTHTINGVTHTHDITTYETVGTCCVQVQTCGCSHTTTVHRPHTSTCGTTTRTYSHAPTTRTYTRSYTSAPVTRTYTRTYTQPAPVMTRRVYVAPPRTSELSYHPDYYRPTYHDDRDEPYAHYDRKWKSRTRGSSRGHYRH